MWLNDTSHTWLDRMSRLPHVAKDRAPDAIAVFAETAKTLIDRAGSQQKAGKKKVAQRSLSRWARGGKESNPRLSKLQELAASRGLQVWQLLVPGFDPDHPPTLAGEESAGHNIKPHEVDLILAIRALSPEAKAIITSVVTSAASKAESAKAPA